MRKIIACVWSALFVVAFALVVFAPVARAHSDIVECTPPMDGTVETAPEKLTCKASQGMKAEGSSLQVFDANGAQVDKKDSAVDLNDPDRLTISVSLDTPKMQDGVYTVKWTTVSADDGDEARGAFKFTVGHGNAQPTATATMAIQTSEPTTAPTVAQTAEPTAAPAATATPATTLPASGSTDNSALVGLVVLFALAVFALGAYGIVRARR